MAIKDIKDQHREAKLSKGSKHKHGGLAPLSLSERMKADLEKIKKRRLPEMFKDLCAALQIYEEVLEEVLVNHVAGEEVQNMYRNKLK